MISKEKQWFKGKRWSADTGGSVALADLDPTRVRRAILVGGAVLVALIVLTAVLILWGPGSHDQLFFKILVLLMGAAFAAIGGFCVWVVAPVAGTRARLMATTPTATAAAVLAGSATGTVELIGTTAGDPGADPASSLVAPLSDTPCLYYGVSVVQVAEDRSDTDDNPMTSNTQRTTVASEASDRPFWLADSTGRVRLVPAGADIAGRVTAQRQEDPRPEDRTGDLLAGELQVKGVTVSLPWRTDGGDRVLGYEITEQIIAAGDPLYVLGPVGTHDGTPAIATTGAKETFVIQVGTEAEATAAARSQERMFRLIGALFAAIGVVFVAVGVGLVIAV
jgi:hypothetical protein